MTYKLYFDASLKDNIPKYAFVLCDDHDYPLFTHSGIAQCDNNSMHAEYYAMLAALHFCKQTLFAIERVIVYGDCKGIINKANQVKNKKWKDSNIQPYLDYFEKIEFVWINRKWNIADRETR